MMFSVVIPVYNGEDTLAQAVESVYRQQYEEFEIVLVDDGSTDSTPALCDGYAEKDSRVKVIHQKNCYLGASRNRGLERAEGKYVFFLDADDVLCDGVFEACVAYDGADVICSNRFYTLDMRTGRCEIKQGDFHNDTPLKQLNTKLAAFSPYTAQSAYRREFLLEQGVFFEEKRINSEDRVWTVKLLQRSNDTKVLEQPVYRYTAHRNGSLMNRMTSAYILDSLRALEELYLEVDTYDYEPVSILKKKIANEFLCFCACAALVREKELSALLMEYVREHLWILGSKDCSARMFLWLRRIIGLKNLLRLCNAVFLHYTTDQ